MISKETIAHQDLIVKLRLSQLLRGLKLKGPRKRGLELRSCLQKRRNTIWQADNDRRSWRVMT